MSSFTLGEEQIMLAPASTFEVAPVVLLPPIQLPNQTPYDAQKTQALNTLRGILGEINDVKNEINSIVNKGSASFTRTDMDAISMMTYALNKRTEEIINTLSPLNPFFGDKSIPEVDELWKSIDKGFADIDSSIDTTIPWMTALAQKLRLTIPIIGSRESKPVLSQQEITVLPEDDTAVPTVEKSKVNPLLLVGAAAAAYFAFKG